MLEILPSLHERSPANVREAAQRIADTSNGASEPRAQDLALVLLWMTDSETVRRAQAKKPKNPPKNTMKKAARQVSKRARKPRKRKKKAQRPEQTAFGRRIQDEDARRKVRGKKKVFIKGDPVD